MTQEEIIIAQQARIEQLRETLQHFALIDLGRDSLPSTFGMDVLASRKALSTPDDLSALRAHDAKLLAPYQWQPIETAPKGELIAIWIVGTNKNGQKWSDEEGECWLYCYHDNICGDWRTTRPSGHLRCVPDRFVTHWMPLPSAEAIEKGGEQ